MIEFPRELIDGMHLMLHRASYINGMRNQLTFMILLSSRK